MPKYKVTFAKYETYYVNANSSDEAEDKAFDKLENNSWAWLEPVDEIKVEECK